MKRITTKSRKVRKVESDLYRFADFTSRFAVVNL